MEGPNPAKRSSSPSDSSSSSDPLDPVGSSSPPGSVGPLPVPDPGAVSPAHAPGSSPVGDPSMYASPGQTPRRPASPRFPGGLSGADFPDLPLGLPRRRKGAHSSSSTFSVGTSGLDHALNTGQYVTTGGSTGLGLPPPLFSGSGFNPPPAPPHEPYSSTNDSLADYLFRVHHDLGPAHTHTGTLKLLPQKHDYGFIHHDQLFRITRRHTFVSNKVLRDCDLLTSHDCQVFFTFDSATNRSNSIRCTWASLVPSALLVPPVLPPHLRSSLVPLGISAAETLPNAFWVVPEEVLPVHVRAGLQEMMNEFGSDLLDQGAQDMLHNQDPKVGFAAINHFARIIRGRGLEHPPSWLVKTIKALQGSMGLPATFGKSRKGLNVGSRETLLPRNSGSSSSASGSLGKRTASRSRSKKPRERERDTLSPPSGYV